ncbi:adenylate cyclase [Micractinium conductrix]|uniref:Adenylate cyclase n=1 Tax=Micractinium conductrix TaxID=554055 RepID=A0A2P6VHX2_9CHLO|nr:adenylate cyclase [Micractinium conductrix]|eukprot:PSC73680.1 adenylate cyclase [Micractinium conductrix]
MGKAKKPPGPWADLQCDVLQSVAAKLPLRDRFKLNLVCRSWRQGLEDAPQVWEAVTVDPRRKASTSRRVRFVKHLPTGEALAAWFGRYGRHTRCLHLRHLDAASQAEGCGAAPDVAALLESVAGGLQQLVVQQCTVQELLSGHAATLRALRSLTSLHVQLPLDEPGLSLGAPGAAFITALSNLQDLALASAYQLPQHALPASLDALPRLRSLQLARVGGPRGVLADLERGSSGGVYMLHVAAGLPRALAALERLVLSDFCLLEEEPGEEEEHAAWRLGRLPPALLGLPALTSLVLADVGLGLRGPIPAAAAATEADARRYPLPAQLGSLAGSLRELVLLNHTAGQEELGALSALTCLTSLSLTAKWRHQPTHAPDALSQLTGLRQLKLSHGLTQVPACITGLTRLTLLDLSFNSLKSLKPGDYLKRLVAVNLRANLLSHFPLQLKVARHTAVELQLPQNDSMTISEKDVEQLLTFDKLKQLTIYGASDDKATRRCLAALQRACPWLLVDV